MADMGFSVGCRRAVIKCICPAVSARVDALFEDLVVLPELLHSLFPLDKIQICGYLVIQHFKILLQQVCFFMKPHTTALTACVPAFETSFTVKYKKNGLRPANRTKTLLRDHLLQRTSIRAFDNGEKPAWLTSGSACSSGGIFGRVLLAPGFHSPRVRFGFCTVLTVSISAFFLVPFIYSTSPRKSQTKHTENLLRAAPC